MPTADHPSSTKSRLRISPIPSMAHDHHHHYRPNLIIFLFLSIFSATTSSSSSSTPSKPLYHPNCNSVVPESKSTGQELNPSASIELASSYFEGGKTLFPSQTPDSESLSYPKSIYFRTSYLYATETPGIVKIQATLIFRGGSTYSLSNVTTLGVLGTRHFQVVRPRSPRVFRRRGEVTFDLRGFWSEDSGKLCMVGTGSGYTKEGNLLDLSAVFKLNYPKISNISTSMVTGTVESLAAEGDSNYFDKISVLAYGQKMYKYTLVEQSGSAFDGNDGGEESLGLESDSSVCSELLSLGNGGFRLDYEGDCSKKNCSIFYGRVGCFLPSFMTVGGVQCSDKGRLRMFLLFSNTSYYAYGAALAPEMMLVGEGVWDEEKNRVCFAGCRVLNFTGSLENTTVGDCSIRLTLRFPKILSMKVRSFALGYIWSNKKANDSGYFDRIGFRSLEDRSMGVPDLKYEYTEMGRVGELCKEEVKKSGKRYPDGLTYEDMRFYFSANNMKRRIAWGDSSPLTVGDRFYNNPSTESTTKMPSGEVQPLNHSPLNVSYMISFTLLDSGWGGPSFNQTSSGYNMRIDIAAEGVYYAKTGILCMVGCRYLDSVGKSLAKNNDTLDCGILINVKFAPFNPESGRHLKGTIKSTREKFDPLYFEPLQLSSNELYTSEAIGAIRRMDLELIMVLISLMFACVFIGLQLFYVKKHPDVLSSVSLMMLVVLTLGHMIPLVLNFEALFFSDRNRQNVLLWSGGWLEVNEVVVRVVTMVAFLLQFRLLQLAWSARLADEGKKGLWVAEKKAVSLCLPLYVVGGLIALFIHWKMSKVTKLEDHFNEFVANSQHSIWEDLRSYAGLILDGFLLPQILLNLFWDSKDKALAPSFYIGTTAVRSLPHAYDAYRAHKYAPHFGTSYIYANPDADFYSPAWDIIIPCGGLVFAIVIYLQQRFGGAFILPRRFIRSAEYQKVPIVGA